ncbi:ATP-DEPENDENT CASEINOLYTIC PROTEASE/CROTONASE FAMILY PROTEIN [Salix viminalis]|uniref:ATP-DEPENDENT CASEINOLYTIC PROTEASE/CROTONASE FAMILY PROTEIN n=1 Tax=Salix viminalis TaxID=40686 RepID=A0A9Q0QCE7_SALVM|nr:ATP-DEPENDENT CASEINOLYTIC PROTEASE/CROTONASE FAMILY PROTEIN [Salix viminalis]
MENTSDSDSQAIPDSSPPLPSEPPDIRNWFPSYQYESFVLDTYDVFGGSIHKETDFECLKDGCLCIEEGSKGKEIISCDATRIDNNSSDDNQHEDQSFNKMPDSLCSLSLLSEPPDVRNWFPSYDYESPVLDTAEYFNESAIKESEGEKDGFATEESKKRREEKAGDLSNSGNNEIRANEKPSSYGFIKCKSSYGDVCDNKPLSKVPDSSQSSSFLSEPPDIRNWFPSYVYESPVPGESIGFLHGITEREGDDLANQDSKRDEEKDLWKLGQNRSSEETEHSNGFLKLNSSLGNHKQEKSLNKVSPSQDTRDVEKEGSSILDNLHREGKLGMEDESFLNHAIAPTEDIEKPSLRLEVPPFKQPHMQNPVQEVGFMSVTSTVRSSDKSATKLNYRKDSAENLDKARTEIDLVSPRGNVKFARGAGVFSMSQSANGRSNNKENEGKEAQGNGFVTTRKSRITKPNVENSLDRHRQQQILSECSEGRGMTSRDGERDEKDAAVKRKVLSEVSNLEHPDGIGVTGKWKCPQKSKPNLGPPMKQLRLERWVHRL